MLQHPICPLEQFKAWFVEASSDVPIRFGEFPLVRTEESDQST